MAGELAYWPEPIIKLNEELATGLHPELEKKLNAIQGEANFIERFATIAAYCDIALDGMYTSDQMVAMVQEFFIPRLIARRKRPDNVILVS